MVSLYSQTQNLIKRFFLYEVIYSCVHISSESFSELKYELKVHNYVIYCKNVSAVGDCERSFQIVGKLLDYDSTLN